jgi:hypothetical protein
MIISKINTNAEKEYTGYSKTESPLNNSGDDVRKRTMFSLIIVWAASAIMCLLLFLLSGPAEKNDSDSIDSLVKNADREGLFHKNRRYQKTNADPNDAFVFVKFNRKYIITPYPSNQQPESFLTAENFKKKNQSSDDAVTATKVIRRLKKTAKNNSKDFSIKPFPK